MQIGRTMLAAAVTVAAGLAAPADGLGAERRPNVVVILADDMGYSDIGCYGSEIPTPNLDALAAQGVRFDQFYNYARCCPSRAALLTGLYPHQASMGWMTGTETEHPGYKAGMSTETPTVAEVMRDAGYATYMVGKWHVSASARVDGPKGNWPVGRGFERFYGTITGGGSFYDPAVLVRQEQAISPFTDEEYKPEGGKYYYTTALGAHAAKFVKEHKERAGAEKPFFMYVSFTAPHWPLHAPEEVVAKYKGKYDGGYEPVREARLKRQKELGVVPAGTVLSPQALEWSKIENKAWEARCMEVYAAQMELMDREIGRLVSALKEAGEYEDTVVMFMADNGGCAEDMGRNGYKGAGKQRVLNESEIQTWIWPEYTRDGETVRGGPGVMPGPGTTYIAYGQGWANVSNTPFREYKHWVHEGGIATPLVVSWPNGVKGQGRWERQYGSIIDLMATCVDLAGTKGPPKTEGVSLVPAFRGQQVERKQPIFWEHEGNRAVREGKWKLVAKGAEGAWELYDIEADRAEMRDLATSEPGRVKEMAAAWQAWAERSQVLPLTPYFKKAEN